MTNWADWKLHSVENGVKTEFLAYAAFYWGQRNIGRRYGEKINQKDFRIEPSAIESNREFLTLLDFVNRKETE